MTDQSPTHLIEVQFPPLTERMNLDQARNHWSELAKGVVESGEFFSGTHFNTLMIRCGVNGLAASMFLLPKTDPKEAFSRIQKIVGEDNATLYDFECYSS